jgi:uncharacterized hydrophobic protein (TIGR00271 family)
MSQRAASPDGEAGAAATGPRPRLDPWRWLRLRFQLRRDTDYDGTVEHLTSNVVFRGGNLWALVLAILVASIGLNVNSTAVIIGAMLISPLMGPIMGAGLAIGTDDLTLLRRSLWNLTVAAVISVAASAAYFALSPLSQAQSELLARTRPTLYDVLVAFLGGSAGIIAASRKGDKSTVVPGVAIATALMPPLCTAGFALASGSWSFFLGATYLFLINSVFICLATVLFVRILRFPRVLEPDPARERRVRLAITVAVILTVVPSGFVAWTVVRESLFRSAAARFIRDEIQLPGRSVIASVIRYGRDSSIVDVTLVGPPLPAELRSSLERRLAAVGLDRTRLTIREPMQPGPGTEELSAAVRAGILEDLYRTNQAALDARDTRIRLLEDEVVRLQPRQLPVAPLSRELVALYPELLSLGFGRIASLTDSVAPDSTVAVLTTWRRRPSDADMTRLRAFLTERLAVDSVDLIVRVAGSR